MGGWAWGGGTKEGLACRAGGGGGWLPSERSKRVCSVVSCCVSDRGV